MPQEAVPAKLKQVRKELNDLKWESLKKRGIFPPKDEEERKKRLEAAHGY